jgi:hypothetical protein
MLFRIDKAAPSRQRLHAWLVRWWTWIAALAVLALAFLHARALIWTSDDAFASFRYARNWVRGLGLVFNAGERVEGITNPLWTLALGVLASIGCDIEASATALGVLAYLGSIALLLRMDHKSAHGTQGVPVLLPLAATIGVADVDWATFASGGLETSLFTLSLTACYFAIAHVKAPRVAGAVAGCLLACAGMVRPDGILVAPALAVGLMRRDRRPGLLTFASTALPLLAAFHSWRRWYYGDWLPNTYYAKSAFLTWWKQGLVYAGYFAERHAAVLIAIAGCAAIAAVTGFGARREQPTRAPGRESALWHQLLTSCAVVGVYGLGVTRVGGDFMYARLLVPVIPFLALATSAALQLGIESPAIRSCAGAVVAGALFFTPCPVGTSLSEHHGVVDERAYYQAGYAESTEAVAAKLHACLGNYPTRVAIYGGELRLAYRADFAYAIESHAGLTDPFVAHQPLTARHRIGHEKSAPAAYLVSERRVHFAVSPLYASLSDPNGYIHNIHAKLCGVDVRLLHWDAQFVDYVRSRGATVTDYPKWLDLLIAQLPRMPDATVRRHWEMARHFYFDFVNDAARAQAFESRLGPVQLP